MRTESASPAQSRLKTPEAPPVVLSHWVNERYPSLAEILTARDVARLTRRSWWLLLSQGFWVESFRPAK